MIAAGNGDVAVGTKGIALPLDRPRRRAPRRPRATAHVGRAASRRHRDLRSCRPVRAQGGPGHPLPAGGHRRAYKLTPTELRVLLAIVEIGGAPEVAEALGIADGTVKTHLGRLFEKTGAKRQADLVKLVAGFSNPLVG